MEEKKKKLSAEETIEYRLKWKMTKINQKGIVSNERKNRKECNGLPQTGGGI